MSGETAVTQVDRATLLRTHYALQRGSFISASEEVAGGVVACSDKSAAPMWNHAAWWGGTDFQEFLETSENWQSQRERVSIIYVADDDRNEKRILAERGYEHFDTEAWLVRPKGGKRSSRVREVQDSPEFFKIFSSSFSAAGDGYREALSGGRMRHFVSFQGEAPAAIGTLAHSGPWACIYNVGVAPEFRRQGLAREIVEHLLAEANGDGVFLQVESESGAERLYRSIGFELAFVRQGFRSTATVEGTVLSTVFAGRGEAGDEARETRGLPFADLAPELLIGAWACLLHRYSGQHEVVFAINEGVRGNGLLTIPIEHTVSVEQWLRAIGKRMPRFATGQVETGLSLGAHKLRTQAFELHIDEAAQSLVITYRPELFSKQVVRRIAGHYIQVIRALRSRPNALVRDIELLPEAERHQLLIKWNTTNFVPADTTYAKLFAEQVERDPEAVALIFTSASRDQLTYRQLNRRANRLAHRLLEMGVGAGVPVALLLDRSVESVLAILAVLKAGGMFVPLDLSYPAERINGILGELRSCVVITQQKRALPRGCRALLLNEQLRDQNEKNPAVSPQSHDPAYIIYTSGSTGRPKGVVVSHYALANHVQDCKREYGLSPRDRVLQFSSFSFDAALEQLLPALVSGAMVVLRDEEIWNARQFSEKVCEFQLTVADLPTAYWHDLVEYWANHQKEFAQHCLRLMIVGGEALSPDKAVLWRAASDGKVRLINAYGPTETTITATSCELDSLVSGSGRVPIGRPRADRKTYVLDSFGRPAPIGVPGELHIGGTLLAQEYYRNPRLTAERFIPNPFSDDPSSRLYKTGDLVRYFEDGQLEFLGRIDDQVKIRGYRIELGEIESVLRGHSAVRDALVLARDNRLIAYVKGAGSDAELKSYLREKLPGFMVPAHLFVLTDWPLLPSGKVDRKALLLKADEDGTAGSGPKDALELQLKLLFERVLKRTPVGTDQSFFELGGDSLQALELLVRIEKETNKRLPLEFLYQAPTVEAIARELKDGRTKESWSSLVPLQASGTRPPFFLLHTTPGDVLGYGNLVYRLGPEQPCYGIQSLGLKGPGLSHRSIEEMAAYYVELLRAFQPEGPYYLGGWCYGGIVAVEIARLLKAGGAEVGFLALFETVAMPATVTHLRYYAHRLRRKLAMSPYRWVTYVREKLHYTRNARIADRMRFREAGETRDPRLIHLEQIYKANMLALGQYRSRFYNGEVTLFNASEKDPALISDAQYGWVGLAREIKIFEVPGNHDTMLTEPNVSVLAELLGDCLQKAQARRVR